MTQMNDEQREAQREAAVADSFGLANKARFGLFGQPAPIALGDNSGYDKTKSKKNQEEGGVDVGPRNFYTGNLKKLGIKKSEETVDYPGFITNATGNPYQVAQPAGLRVFSKHSPAKYGQDVDWRMAREVTHQRGARPVLEFMEEGPIKRASKVVDGEVMIGPRNFNVKPMATGRTKTSMVIHPDGHFEYKEDDYNIQKKMAGAEVKAHRECIEKVHDSKPFSQKAGKKNWKQLHDGHFNTHHQVFGNDVELPPLPKRRSSVVTFPQHDKAFKPSGTKETKALQLQDYIGKFPEYKENPLTEKKRRVWDDDDPKGWRTPFKALGGPTPSIALNRANIRSQFPSAFMRKKSL